MAEQRTAKERAGAPHLPATAVHAKLTRTSKNIVYVRIKVMDQKGDTYYFDAGVSVIDLKHPEEIGEERT